MNDFLAGGDSIRRYYVLGPFTLVSIDPRSQFVTQSPPPLRAGPVSVLSFFTFPERTRLMESDLEKRIAEMLAQAAVEKSRRKLRALNDEIERLMDELEQRKATKAS